MRRFDVVIDKRGEDGWFGGRPPGLKSIQWPRSRNTGLPMVHIMTLRLPYDYARRGPEYSAISLFQAHDVEASEMDGVSELLEGGVALSEEQQDDDYYVAIAKAAKGKHPRERVWTEPDIGFALVWLTQAEFRGKPTPLPREVRHEDLEDAPAAWDAEAERQRFRLVETDDPNAGKSLREMTSAECLPGEAKPVDEGPSMIGYVPYERLPEDVQQRLGYAKTHLGGTVTPPGNLDIPPTMTPYVLEFNEVGGMGGANLAGGGLLLDLQTETLVWSGA